MIDDWLNKAKNLHTNIANDVFPNGGKLTCLRCSHQETFTAAQAASYLAEGWPKHCGVAMRLETAVSQETP